MKKILWILILCLAVGRVFGWSYKEVLEESFDSDNKALKVNISTDMPGSQKTPWTPICSTRTTHVLDIYINGGYDEVHSAVTVYITGGSTTTAANYRVWADSVAFTTEDGLYPGTTHWIFARSSQDTLTEAVAYWNAIDTTGVVGIEGGITMTLISNGSRPSTQLTVTSSATCFEVANIATLTATPACTAICIVSADSATFTNTGGLQAGSTYWQFNYANQDTLGEAISYWNAASTSTPGIEGGIVMVLRQGAYDGNLSSSMTARSSVSAHTDTNTIVFNTDAIIGMTYTILATADKVNYITNCVPNATFASGNTYVNIYDGTAVSDTRLRREKIPTSATDAKLDIGNTVDTYLFGTENTAMRIDVVNESGIPITAGQINILGFIK